MGGRAQSAWKVSYLCKSIQCDLLSLYSICTAVVQQVCGLQGHKSTHRHFSSIPAVLPLEKCDFCTVPQLIQGKWLMLSGNKLWQCPGQGMAHSQACERVSRQYPARPRDGHQQCRSFRVWDGPPFCLSAGAMACLRRSFEYFKLQYFVGDRLFSKKSFSHRHLAFLVMPPFFFLFSEYSFSGVQWKRRNLLNVTFIKDEKRVKSTSFYCVLHSVIVIYKETTATELSHFNHCFIFNFSYIKLWYPPPFSLRLSRKLCNWQYSELFLKELSLFFLCVCQEF